MRVKATANGYYNLLRRYPGDIFDLKNKKDFSENWMEPVQAKPSKKKDVEPEAELESDDSQEFLSSGDQEVI